MAAEIFDYSWMWHPSLREDSTNTAGRFVHFRKKVSVASQLLRTLLIHVTADTRYKFSVNGQLLSFGPVKGDASLSFYDEIGIVPCLKAGDKLFAVNLLSLLYGTSYGTIFPRMGSGGLRVKTASPDRDLTPKIESSTSRETAIDKYTILPIDESEDNFLYVYEGSINEDPKSHMTLNWGPAKLLRYQSSTGVTAPCKFPPRLIPSMRKVKTGLSALHDVESYLARGLVAGNNY